MPQICLYPPKRHMYQAPPPAPPDSASAVPKRVMISRARPMRSGRSCNTPTVAMASRAHIRHMRVRQDTSTVTSHSHDYACVCGCENNDDSMLESSGSTDG